MDVGQFIFFNTDAPSSLMQIVTTGDIIKTGEQCLPNPSTHMAWEEIATVIINSAGVASFESHQQQKWGRKGGVDQKKVPVWKLWRICSWAFVRNF